MTYAGQICPRRTERVWRVTKADEEHFELHVHPGGFQVREYGEVVLHGDTDLSNMSAAAVLTWLDCLGLRSDEPLPLPAPIRRSAVEADLARLRAAGTAHTDTAMRQAIAQSTAAHESYLSSI